MKKYPTFEEYLQDRHAENYNGTDDDMPEKYETWFMSMDINEVLDYGDAYGRHLVSLFEKSNG